MDPIASKVMFIFLGSWKSPKVLKSRVPAVVFLSLRNSRSSKRLKFRVSKVSPKIATGSQAHGEFPGRQRHRPLLLAPRSDPRSGAPFAGLGGASIRDESGSDSYLEL